MSATRPKVSELKKTLGLDFKDELKRISGKHSWSSIKCNQKDREMVLTASSDDPSVDALRALVDRVNAVIANNWPDSGITMRLALFSLSFAGEVA